MDNFDPYYVFLAIATNIPVLLMTAFVLQGHIYLTVKVSLQSLLQKCYWFKEKCPEQAHNALLRHSQFKITSLIVTLLKMWLLQA